MWMKYTYFDYVNGFLNSTKDEKQIKVFSLFNWWLPLIMYYI